MRWSIRQSTDDDICANGPKPMDTTAGGRAVAGGSGAVSAQRGVHSHAVTTDAKGATLEGKEDAN